MSEKLENSDHVLQTRSKRSVLFNALVTPIIIFFLYYTLSLLDIWGYFPSSVHIAGYALFILFSIGFFIFSLLKKNETPDRTSGYRVLFYATVTFFVALWSGDNFSRLTTLAFMPRAVFDYPSPEVVATVTPPLYLKRDSVSKRMQNINDTNNSLNPIYEGSILEVEVTNTRWRPDIVLSDGQTIVFEKLGDGHFKGSTKIDKQIFWSLQQGSYVIGQWPIILIDDENPEIVNFSLENTDNEKGYMAFNIDIQDDRKITKVMLDISLSDKENIAENEKKENHILPINNIKSFENKFYLDLTGSEYSGQEVDFKLSVEDEAGQMTTALLNNAKLPEKVFVHPVANKLISLRKELNEAGYDLKSLSRQINALGLLSDDERLPPVYYIALRSAYWRLVDPASENDIESAKDLLWDIAIRLNGGDISAVENELVSSLDQLTLAIKQQKTVREIREQIRNSDRLFREYSQNMRGNISNLYTLDIDLKSLRKLYSYILGFSDQGNFYNAALIVDFIRKGLIYNNEMILSKGGLGNYVVLSEGGKIIDNLISVQKSLLASSYNDHMMDQVILPNKSAKMSANEIKLKQDRIDLQIKVGNAVKLLGEKISYTGIPSELLIQSASDLVEEILVNMKSSELSQVTQSQTQLIAVMSNLKRLINKPIKQSPELQDILQVINAEPVS